MAAQLCKADVGPVKSYRRKLEHVCKLLVSAGILDDSIGDGLSVREQDASICNKPTVEGENTAKLISLQNDVIRMDKVAKAARDEMRRALRAVEDATNATEKVEDECRQVDVRCSKVSSHFAEVRKAAKENRERIETNSTRLFRLTADVEHLADRKSCSGYAGTSMYPSREETRDTWEEAGDISVVEIDVSTVEIADLNIVRSELPPSEPPLPSTTEEEGETAGTPTTDREELPSTVMTEVLDEGDPEGGQGKVETIPQNHAPRRPGVLVDAPGDTEPQQRTCAGLLSASVPVAFNVSSPRATRVGRRVVTGKYQEQSVESVRPCMSRPSKARSTPYPPEQGSWPLLASEVGRILAGAVGEDADDANQIKHMTREPSSMPNLTRKPTMELDTPKQDENVEHSSAVCTPGYTAVGGHDEDLNSAARQADTGRSVSDYIVHLRNLGSPRTSSPQPLLGGVTAPIDDPEKENAARPARGQGRCIGVFEPFQPSTDNDNTRDGEEAWGVTPVAGTNRGKTKFDAEGGVAARRQGPCGAGLACLEGAPTLWCPRDTWEAVESSVGSNSSTSGRRGEDSTTTLCDPSIVGKTDQP